VTVPIEQLLKQAIAAQRNGAFEDARRLYRQVLEIDPRSEAACSNLAIVTARHGDPAGAEQLFRRALELRPDYPEGFNNLGLLLQQQGRAADAVAAHQRAIALRPGYPEAYFGLGNALKLQGRLDEALEVYDQAVKLKPNYVQARNNIGVILQHQGKLDGALAAYKAAVALRPDYVEAHFNLGVVLQEQDELDGAAAAYRKVIALSPEIPDAHSNLGTVLQKQGRLDEAITAFGDALACNPGYAEAHYNRGLVLQLQAKPEEALAAYVQAVKLKPDYVEAINNAGIALQELGRSDEAISAHRQAVGLRPTYAEARNNLGVALLAQLRFEEASTELQQALVLKPDYPEAYYNIGSACRELGKLDAAIVAYDAALRLRPNYSEAFSQLVYHRWRACDWTNYEADQEKLLDTVRRGVARVPPFHLFATQALPVDQLECARQWAKPIAPPPGDVFRHSPSAERGRIRLGYLSGDFHQHATAHLTAELFERHDRAAFEVIAYSYGGDDMSPMRRRLDRAFDRFVDVRALSYRQAAERIRTDEVDILIDLKGYTYRARPQIIAYRPAPVQVSYLGYPASMGADFVDYIVVDSHVVPDTESVFFSEKLVRLPGCYQVNDSRRAISASPPSRQDCGLPPDALVFCSFNNSYKITPVFFDIWMRLLAAVPGSVLWLLEANDLVRRNLRREAERRGIVADRLVFAPLLPPAEHLARHRQADLFLDTLPCSAHTTASDALWTGLPVLTCTGGSFAGRVAGSLLMAIGLPELITGSLEEYEQLALDLAGSPRRLIELRERLQQNRGKTALFDPCRFARNIEAAYVQMWSAWWAGAKPAAFSIEGR
jgi:protein O-GlcNAc transferase